MFTQILGFRHHGIEYWETSDPESAATVKQCAADGEDPTCSDSNLISQGPDSAHGYVSSWSPYLASF
jgi:hypothetical protein